MLLLADRGYDGYQAFRDAAATGADLLWRAQAGRLLPVLQPLEDGSYLSHILDRRSGDRLAAWRRRKCPVPPPELTAVPVRVIAYQVTVTSGDGRQSATDVRLITTLLDPARYPAAELAACYHQRWEIETAYFGLKVTLRGADRVCAPTPQAASSRRSTPCWPSSSSPAPPSPRPPLALESTPTTCPSPSPCAPYATP